MTDDPRRPLAMNPLAGPVALTECELEAIAWRFLGSEFAGLIYADWPVERRVDAYLTHRGMSDVVNNGDAFNAVLQHVLTNIGPAHAQSSTRQYDLANVAAASRRNPVSTTGARPSPESSLLIRTPEGTMMITKQQALRMLAKIGRHDMICEAALTLPDPIDVDRDAALLARYGLERSQLMERFGASP
jgi:hypothetical protein